jgi:hypothetical protein
MLYYNMPIGSSKVFILIIIWNNIRIFFNLGNILELHVLRQYECVRALE